jgi:hypothetical protein
MEEENRSDSRKKNQQVSATTREPLIVNKEGKENSKLEMKHALTGGGEWSSRTTCSRFVREANETRRMDSRSLQHRNCT